MPTTLAEASSWAAPSAVPAGTGAGVFQVITGVVLVEPVLLEEPQPLQTAVKTERTIRRVNLETFSTMKTLRIIKPLT